MCIQENIFRPHFAQVWFKVSISWGCVINIDLEVYRKLLFLVFFGGGEFWVGTDCKIAMVVICPYSYIIMVIICPYGYIIMVDICAYGYIIEVCVKSWFYKEMYFCISTKLIFQYNFHRLVHVGSSTRRRRLVYLLRWCTTSRGRCSKSRLAGS